MKILGVNCSPRKLGNTWLLLEEALIGARECGAGTEMCTIVDLEIRPCDGCLACVKTLQCHIKDDMQTVYPRVLAADGIIFATPVYFLNMTAQAKIFIDRLYSLYVGQKLANKVGGAIAVATRTGHSQVWNSFNLFFAVTRMLPSDFVAGFGWEKGDIKKDKHAMQSARELGKLVASIAKSEYKWPKEYDNMLAKYVSNRYGIDLAPGGDRFERP